MSVTPTPVTRKPSPVIRDSSPPSSSKCNEFESPLMNMSDSSFNDRDNDMTHIAVLVEETMRSVTNLNDNMMKRFGELVDGQKKIENMIAGLEKEMALIKSAKESSDNLSVPKNVSRNIRKMYQKLPEDEKWDLDEVFTSTVNQEITDQFVADVVDKKKYEEAVVIASCRRYFNSLRKEYVREDQDDAKVKRRVNSRRHRLYETRSRHVADAELEQWKLVTPELMSDEEDGDDGKIKVKSPKLQRAPWLNDLIIKLDERFNSTLASSTAPRKERVIGMSPMKRLLSNRVKDVCLRDAHFSIDKSVVDDDDDFDDDNDL